MRLCRESPDGSKRCPPRQHTPFPYPGASGVGPDQAINPGAFHLVTFRQGRKLRPWGHDDLTGPVDDLGGEHSRGNAIDEVDLDRATFHVILPLLMCASSNSPRARGHPSAHDFIGVPPADLLAHGVRNQVEKAGSPVTHELVERIHPKGEWGQFCSFSCVVRCSHGAFPPMMRFVTYPILVERVKGGSV